MTPPGRSSPRAAASPPRTSCTCSSTCERITAPASPAAAGSENSVPVYPSGARHRAGRGGAAGRRIHAHERPVPQPGEVPQQSAVGAADVHDPGVARGHVRGDGLRRGREPGVVPGLLAAARAGARVLVLGEPGVVGVVLRLGDAGVGVDEAAGPAADHVVAQAQRVARRQHERLAMEHLGPTSEADGAGPHGCAAQRRVRRTPSSKPIHSSSPSSARARVVSGT